MLEDKAEQI